MASSIRLPLLFVMLLSTTYIAFGYCSAYVEPATFVVLRTSTTAATLFLVAIALRVSWPSRSIDITHSVIVGILMHGVYGIGVFAAIYHGMDISLCALILSLQPLITVLLSGAFLGEKITLRKLLGVLIGLLGVSLLILQDNARFFNSKSAGGFAPSDENSLFAISMCLLALLAISTGIILQKRHRSEAKLLPNACIQFTAAAIFTLPIAMTTETMHVVWNLGFILGLGWLVLFISIGAMSLLTVLIQRGDAGSVANLFYLVTPLVALQAWVIFDEQLTPVAFVGMVFCMSGVIVANCKTVAKQPDAMVIHP